MRILYTLNSGRPGGMEQHTLDLVATMVQKGHKVWVWCPEGLVSELFKKAGAQVVNKKVSFDIDPSYIYSLVQFLQKEKIDVLHAHELKVVTNSLFAGFLAGTSVKVSHTHTPISTWQINPIIKKIEVFGYSLLVNLFSDREIALTESRKKVKMEEGISESKLVVIPNGLDVSKWEVLPGQKNEYRSEILNRYGIPLDSFVFGCVSRFTEEKGHKYLVEAFEKFLQFSLFDKEKIYLLLAGGGLLEDSIKTLIKDKGLTNRVFVTGVFPGEDLVKFWNSFDAFIFPSLAEGFGFVLIEAMYSQLPIIVSDLEVLQEVGGSTVSYFETGSSEDMAEKMLNLYKRKDRLSELIASAKTRVLELYTLDKFGDLYDKLYTNIREEKA